MKTPTPELLAKWRAEFEFNSIDVRKNINGDYLNHFTAFELSVYLAACQKRQEEIDKLREALLTIKYKSPTLGEAQIVALEVLKVETK
jgi:hypothetical protein